MAFKMDLRENLEKIPDSEIVIYYRGDVSVDRRGIPEIVDLMARGVISAKRKYQSFIVERDFMENTHEISFRITMLLEPSKKKKRKRRSKKDSKEKVERVCT